MSSESVKESRVTDLPLFFGDGRGKGTWSDPTSSRSGPRTKRQDRVFVVERERLGLPTGDWGVRKEEPGYKIGGTILDVSGSEYVRWLSFTRSPRGMREGSIRIVLVEVRSMPTKKIHRTFEVLHSPV